jgi:hypothetical protein
LSNKKPLHFKAVEPAKVCATCVHSETGSVSWSLKVWVECKQYGFELFEAGINPLITASRHVCGDHEFPVKEAPE